MIALLCGLAAAEEPLHHVHGGASLRVLTPLDWMPADPDLGNTTYTPSRVQPSLSYGNITLWGHAELWMSLTPWHGVALWGERDGSHSMNLRMEAGGRVFWRKFERNTWAPWVGASVASVNYRALDGPTRSNLRMQHAIGVSRSRDDWLFTVSVGYVPLVRTRYPLGRENFDDEEDFFFESGGVLYTPEPLVLRFEVERFFGVPEPWTRSRWDPYLALGVSGARSVGSLSSRQVDRSFLRGPAPPTVFPELSLGLDFPKLFSLDFSYRHIWQRQDAFGLVADWKRDSLAATFLFESPYAIGDVNVYVGAGLSADYLRYADADFGVPVQVASATALRPVGTLGIRYRPAETEWLRVRSHVRITPLLIASSGSVRASFQHIEVNLLQVEVHPRRF